MLPHLAKNIHRLPFESRKDAHIIFSNVLRFKLPNQDLPWALNYLAEQRPDIITTLCHGYDHRESAMPCGNILREALKLDAIAAIILYDEPLPEGQKIDLRKVDSTIPSSGQGVFWKFFDWIDRGAFEVSADAFSTFRVSQSFPAPLVLTNTFARKSLQNTRNWQRITSKPTWSSSCLATIRSSYSQPPM